MRDDELEQRPAPSWPQPISAAQDGQRMPLQLADQRALPERPVDDHGDAALARQRQDALLDLAVEHVVGDLHEVDRLRAP